MLLKCARTKSEWGTGWYGSNWILRHVDRSCRNCPGVFVADGWVMCWRLCAWCRLRSKWWMTGGRGRGTFSTSSGTWEPRVRPDYSDSILSGVSSTNCAPATKTPWRRLIQILSKWSFNTRQHICWARYMLSPVRLPVRLDQSKTASASWNDVMAATLKVWRLVENPTPSIDACLIEKQLHQSMRV